MSGSKQITLMVLTVLEILMVTTAIAIDKVTEEENVKHIMHSGGQQESAFDHIANHNRALKEKQKLILFEADIQLTEQPEYLNTPLSSISGQRENVSMKRSLRRSMEYLWIDRVIPYEFTSSVEHGKETIIHAFEELEKQSCLSFVKRTNQRNWIQFENKGACFSGVGRLFWRKGAQTISLSNSCLNNHGTIIHEILHALGFWHEQSRPDRDHHVEIMWENIAEGEEHNFEKYSRGEADDLQSTYDLNSIMHYGRLTFSKNGRPTINSISDKTQRLGQRHSLSKSDVIQLNALYRCDDVGKIYTTWSEWSPCDYKACSKSRQRFCSNYDKSRCPEASRYGIHTQIKECTKEECYKPIDGHWGRWGSWRECNQECGGGEKTRNRTCDDPKPYYGGAKCKGNAVQTAECFVKPCGLNADDCQFDGQGMCFWRDESGADYMWKRIEGKTPSANTGPDGDHSTMQTTMEGHYLFTESSSPASIGDRANLISKPFPGDTNRCMTFFYSMNGLGVGALRIFMVSENTVEPMMKIWEKFGPQGNEWKEAEVDISSRYEYKIKFQSERGATFQGDIGLDDIYFREGKCSDPPTNPLKKSVPPTDPPTAPIFRTSTVKRQTTTEKMHLHQDYLSSICGIKIKAIGCFADIPSDPSMEVMLDNHRGGTSLNHGVMIDWQHFGHSSRQLLCDCVNRAKSRGMQYIGLQFYGECWATNSPSYQRYGMAPTCLDSKYKRCAYQNKKDVCVGQAKTNYVYQIF